MTHAHTVADLWCEHRGFVAVVLLAHRPRGADIEDLLQEVALAMASRIDDLRDASCARPWLRRIAIRVALAAARRARSRPAPASLDQDVPCRADLGIPSVVGLREEAARVLAAALCLSRQLREPLLMRSVYGLGQGEIASALQISEAAVESRLARARQRLREHLTHGREHDRMRVADRPGVERG